MQIFHDRKLSQLQRLVEICRKAFAVVLFVLENFTRKLLW